ELGVEGEHAAVRRDHQGIDFDQRAITREVEPEQAADHGDCLLELLARQPQAVRQAPGLEVLDPSAGWAPSRESRPGVFAATSSMSMPPAWEASATWVARARSRVIER